MIRSTELLLAMLQVCGALKNVVALAGGFCEGMGQGTNTKAAILRLGVEEIKTFTMLFFGDLLAVGGLIQVPAFQPSRGSCSNQGLVPCIGHFLLHRLLSPQTPALPSSECVWLLQDTLYDSAGYADVITTVFGGRNARVAAAFVRQKGKDWDQLEKEMLNGQKLQVRMR